jgi:hypothetical protein
MTSPFFLLLLLLLLSIPHVISTLKAFPSHELRNEIVLNKNNNNNNKSGMNHALIAIK